MSILKGLLVCVLFVGGLSKGLTASIESKLEMKKSIENCGKELSLTCLKLEFVKLLEQLTERKEIDILPGLSVIQDANVTLQKNTELIAEIARSFPKDPDQRLNAFIMKKIKNFLQSRSLRFKLLGSDDDSALEEFSITGRKGKFHKKGGMEALLAAGIMMKGTLMALGMGTLAIIAGKALLTALMALTLSGAIGLKSLTSSGSKSTTYEIVAKPIYTTSHSHSVSHEDGHQHGGHYSAHSGSGYGGGYGRSIDLDLPNHLKAP